MKVKNFAIWLRYNSRSGTHNMYKEYRALSRAEAVEAMYQDLAARHRARFGSIHVRTHRVGQLTPDPEGRRDREDGGHSPPLHQAAHRQEPALPSAPPPQPRQGHLRRQAPRYVLLSDGVVYLVSSGISHQAPSCVI